MVIDIPSSQERRTKREEAHRARNEAIMARFNELRSEYDINDCCIIVAGEFGLSLQTIYNIRRKNR